MIKIRPSRLSDRLNLVKGKFFLWVLWGLRASCKTKLSRFLYERLIINCVRRTELFDSVWYLENNPDVVCSEMSAIKHYVVYGDKEGRGAQPLFDATHYKSKIRSRTKYVNSIIHYVYVGRYLRISPSSWFNLDYYLNNNKDVFRSGVEPLGHYLKYGGIEGRAPSENFDVDLYLQKNPEVKSARVNPLYHYLQNGGGYDVDSVALFEDVDSETSEKDFFDFTKLNVIKNFEEPKVDVIIPVYGDADLTLRCIVSVLRASNNVEYELIVINDASPEPELSNKLDEMAKSGLFTLLINQHNLGFVETVNLGMSLHDERDVVLLNSDTEVYNDWLDRMYNVARKNEHIATVTPLSNNATICSYPLFLHDNPYPLDIRYNDLDRLCKKYNAGTEVEAPTGVGFCMYIRRDALNQVGLFDSETYGKGYGEENDFCQRAIQKGLKNIISPEIFVRHLGGASFKGEKAKRVSNAIKILNKKYPDYQHQINEFIKRDELISARSTLDMERLKAHVRTNNVLMICHRRGGGSERHLQEDVRRLKNDGSGVFVLRPERENPSHIRIEHSTCRQLVNLPAIDLSDTKAMVQLLRSLNITSIHTHGLVDFVPDAPLKVGLIAKELNIPLLADIHDYKVICPRINLADENGKYCGEPGEDECNNCLKKRGSSFGVIDITKWRAIHHQVLKKCEKICVPDEDVAIRLSKYYPDLPYSVEPHDKSNYNFMPVKRTGSDERSVHVVVIGAISKLKGFEILLSCARDAKKNKLPIKFTVLGYTMNDPKLTKLGVDITGKYQENEAVTRLKELNADLIWFPAIWPETYSYTLSIALEINRPIAAFDLGAIASRLRKIGLEDKLLSIDYIDQPEIINRNLLNV